MFDPSIHHRRSIRLDGYDYRSAGAYFVTICIHNRALLLGKVVGGVSSGGSAVSEEEANPLNADARNLPQVDLTEAGRMVQTFWDEIPQHYPGVDVDVFVVMPNHVHGIIVLAAEATRPPGNAQRMGLPDVVHRFKSLTTARYRHGVHDQEWPPFEGQFWQRNYYEHIIRDERDLDRIRQYIAENPARWMEDRENPAVAGGTPSGHF